MPATEITRLTITWSKDTDLAARSYLGTRGLKSGALSKFIEDAVKWRLFDETIQQARERFAGIPRQEIEALVDEAVQTTRQDMRKELQKNRKKP
jgi:hypothetical protein